MITLTIVLIVICLACWDTLNYLDSMGKLQKKLRRDSLKYKILANENLEDNDASGFFTQINGNSESRTSAIYRRIS